MALKEVQKSTKMSFNVVLMTGHRASVSVDRYKRFRNDGEKKKGFSVLTKRLRTEQSGEACEDANFDHVDSSAPKSKTRTNIEHETICVEDVKSNIGMKEGHKVKIAAACEDSTLSTSKGGMQGEVAAVLSSVLHGCNLLAQQVHFSVNMKSG